MKLKKPKFWDYKEPHLYSYLLLPFSIILSLLSKIRSKPKLTNPQIKTIASEIFILEVLAKHL